MIDLDELQAAINRCAFDGDVLGLSKAECRDLLTLLRQTEKDAARYRLLRLELEQSQGSLALFCGDSYVCDLDAFLDEEMQYNGEGK